MVLTGLVERAMLAAIAATDSEYWSEAAELWFDLAVRPATTAIAAPLAAEAALRSGDLDLADQMRARCEEAGGCPAWLTARFAEAVPLREARKTWFSASGSDADPDALLALKLPRDAIRALASDPCLDAVATRLWLIRAHHMRGEHDRVVALAEGEASPEEAILIEHSRACQARREEGGDMQFRRFSAEHPAAGVLAAAIGA